MADQKPPLPNVQTIPKATIQQWLEIPHEDDVDVNITRTDLDNLFFAINHLITSQSALQDSLIAYSNGELEKANANMDLSKRSNIESINALRSLFSSLMSSALKNRKAHT